MTQQAVCGGYETSELNRPIILLYLFRLGVCVIDFPPRANLGAQVIVFCGAPRGRTLQ